MANQEGQTSLSSGARRDPEFRAPDVSSSPHPLRGGPPPRSVHTAPQVQLPQSPATPPVPPSRQPDEPPQMASANSRVAKEFARAQRHTSRVRVLKWALPVAGVLAIVAIIASLFLTGAQLPSVNLGSLRIDDGKLVMDAARLTGTDDSNRPYDLKAEKAIQDAETPSRIALEGISAKLPMEDTVFAHVTAGNGLYDAEAKTLRLGGVVAVDTDNGMSIRMNDADIDIDSGNLRTTSPVELDTGRANVKSESLFVEDNGKTIIFENRVRMVIQPLGDSSESSAKPASESENALRQARSILDSSQLTSARPLKSE